ncbi:DinB family protein [Metabacillus sp. GX 13764]|uniref:DinB family protein n=1 Tax=Metabacillus kandeliae TaxID=2900151 RepID=UPI001E554980|nr:DinB family protein [Metabacillus kandeliae]MCD7034133.1 DinB family protein [Metabacillus kandeliae]
MEVFASQYHWIKRTREALFTYCETLPQEDYVKEVENFAGDSIRNLHAHVADCYLTWLGIRALGKPISHVQPEAVHTVQDMREVFKETDALVHEFLNEFQGNWEEAVPVSFANGDKAKITPLWLFTHTTTHEFHHKGQIVKIGRQLGYVPPDTDLIEEFSRSTV